MELRRFSWIFVAALFCAGCQSPAGRGGDDAIRAPAYEDDFGEVGSEEITAESLEFDEMLEQRAQFEIKGGGYFPVDIFEPGRSSQSDFGPAIGAKFAFEAFKNVFFGLGFDWSTHDVDAPPLGPGGVPVSGSNQIDPIESWDRFNFLVTADYDIPLWRDPQALILRLGVATGASLMKFDERATSINSFESFWSWVFRPSIGLRFPVVEHVLLFTEASYDVIPQRSLETNETATLLGERPIFSGAAVWFGVAFEWD